MLLLLRVFSEGENTNNLLFATCVKQITSEFVHSSHEENVFCESLKSPPRPAGGGAESCITVAHRNTKTVKIPPEVFRLVFSRIYSQTGGRPPGCPRSARWSWRMWPGWGLLLDRYTSTHTHTHTHSGNSRRLMNIHAAAVLSFVLTLVRSVSLSVRLTALSARLTLVLLSFSLSFPPFFFHFSFSAFLFSQPQGIIIVLFYSSLFPFLVPRQGTLPFFLMHFVFFSSLISFPLFFIFSFISFVFFIIAFVWETDGVSLRNSFMILAVCLDNPLMLLSTDSKQPSILNAPEPPRFSSLHRLHFVLYKQMIGVMLQKAIILFHLSEAHILPDGRCFFSVQSGSSPSLTLSEVGSMKPISIQTIAPWSRKTLNLFWSFSPFFISYSRKSFCPVSGQTFPSCSHVQRCWLQSCRPGRQQWSQEHRALWTVTTTVTRIFGSLWCTRRHKAAEWVSLYL